MQKPMLENTAGIDLLIDRLNAAVELREVPRVTGQIKKELAALISRSAVRLPDHLAAPEPGTYARRLVHRDENRGYTVVAMIWGPGQQTELHDHAGIWCVECVMEGMLDVTQYDLVERDQGRCRFKAQSKVRAGVGHAGCLIPPFEYHVLSNPLSDRTSITLHVYGGEMDHCNVYLPCAEGWWEPSTKQMHYN